MRDASPAQIHHSGYRLVADYFQRPQMNEAFSVASSSLRVRLDSRHRSIIMGGPAEESSRFLKSVPRP